MQFPGKITSIWDEVSWGSDSFTRSNLYKLQSYTYVRGGLDLGDFQDYYRLDLSAGTYTLSVTTEGAMPSPSASTSFRTDIVDSLGSVVLTEGAAHPDPYTDQISFAYSGTDNYYLRITALGSAIDYRAAVSVAAAPGNPNPGGTAQLYLSPGNVSYGPVPGGDLTKVFGSNLSERVTLAANANAVLDPSFVRGNDVLTILGNSESYSISSGVAGATIGSSNGASIRVPAFGAGGGLKVQFNDGAFRLITDDGGNTFRLAPASIDPVGETHGQGRLFLSSGNVTYGPVPGGDVTQVFGSNLTEGVTLATDANAVFDPSFVRGNDAIEILGNSSNYSVFSNVAGITITSNNGAQVRIPAFGSSGGLQIQFSDGAFQIGTDDGGSTFQLTGTSGVQEIAGIPHAIGSQGSSNYVTLDYLPDLTQSEMSNAPTLVFEEYTPTSPLITWDSNASVAGTDDNALLHSVYRFVAQKGEVFDIYSTSFFDPFLLRLYDSTGNTIVANSEADDVPVTLSGILYNQDEIHNWIAPYSGTYFVNASWDQGSFYTFYSLLVFVDNDPPQVASIIA